MSEKCLYCETPITQTEGKREKRFCKPSCCTMWHNKEKNKDKPKGQKGRPKGSKNKYKGVPLPADYVEIKNVQTIDSQGTTALVFKKPLGKKAKNNIQELQQGTTIISITPTTESSYDGVKMAVKHHDEPAQWEPPQLSPFMLARQKAKGGGK